MAALVYADHDNCILSQATRHAVSAAREMDAEVHVLVAGAHCEKVVQQAAHLEGVDSVLVAQSAALEHRLPENVAPLLVQLAVDYSHLVAPATSHGKNVLPRVAARLDVNQVSEISAVIAKDIFERPIYAGNAILRVRSREPKHVITVRTTRFPAVADRDNACAIRTISFEIDAGLSRFVERRISSGDRPELTTASVVVSGGRGMASRENFALLDTLAAPLGAAVGASRAAVDAGFAPSDAQVGQTGKVVAPHVYMALGISGAIQHLAGMKDSRTIIAINQDPDAPIFQIADVGWVGDLFDALPPLTQALANRT